MADPALRFLEYVFLALLYLFFLRVLRAVWVELREPRVGPRGRSLRPRRRCLAPAVERSTAGVKGAASPTRLAVMSVDNGTGELFWLVDELTIGRSSDCAVPLPADNFVSQVHARVFRRENEYWVEDLGARTAP